MKAARLIEFGQPMVIGDIPDPVLGTGEVIVDVVAAPVVPYAKDVLSGARGYLLTLPAVPGYVAIGRVHAVGPDTTRLQVGDWVYCDPVIRSRDAADFPDITLLGLSARGPGGLKLQEHFRDGTWAQQVMLPTENAIPIGEIDAGDAAAWCKMGSLLVPYGGLLALALRPGETILVNGATGNFGSAGVAVALAMGAGVVVATGRDAATLAELERRHGPRVRTVAMTGDESTDRAAMQAAANGPIDCALDLLPPVASPTWARAAIMAVRPYGRVALMGGIGMEGGGVLELPYVWIMRNCMTIIGQWMYPPTAPLQMAGMIRAGLIDIGWYEISAFDLDDAEAAVAHAAAHVGPFRMTVLVP